MTLFRHLPSKMFLYSKFSHSPPQIFPFSTRSFPMTTTKITLQAILKRTFHPKFSDDIFRHYLPNKNFSPPNLFGNGSGLRDFYTFSLLLSKRSRKVPVCHDLLYDTAILTYKINIPHFHFPVRHTGACCHKKAPDVCTTPSFPLKNMSGSERPYS